MGGIEAAQQIQNRDKNVFLIAISGYSTILLCAIRRQSISMPAWQNHLGFWTL
jgi:hypothetical protein